MSIEFVLTTLVIVATPGTGVLFTLAAGLSRGARAAAIAAFGCTLGIVPHMIAAITGLAALLNASAVAFQTLKYLGVAYLVYMAWTTFRDKGALAVPEPTGLTVPSARKVITSAVLLNLLNPKLTVFFFAFLPQFVPSGAPNALARMLALSGIFMLATFVVFAVYGACAAAVRDQVVSRPTVVTWLHRAFGASFLALAGRLAIQNQ
ncbi:LysE family translocator [Nocardia abscessus]|uniref:LysE family translocator n=1 Tax=Nocardia abscessus TaxID=120957 RepID=UPI002458D23A|nr:LysE family translocator [Nocardia abscessus]